MKTILHAAAVAVALVIGSGGAMADPTLDAGWAIDFANSLNTPTSPNSPITFTLTNFGIFSIVDGYDPGDIYQVIDTTDSSVVLTTAFVPLPTNFPEGIGLTDGDTFWGSGTNSEAQIYLNPGDYSFNVVQTTAFTDPAAVFERIDTAPEPASMAIFGVALAGLGLLRRKRA